MHPSISLLFPVMTVVSERNRRHLHLGITCLDMTPDSYTRKIRTPARLIPFAHRTLRCLLQQVVKRLHHFGRHPVRHMTHPQVEINRDRHFPSVQCRWNI